MKIRGIKNRIRPTKTLRYSHRMRKEVAKGLQEWKKKRSKHFK